MYAALISFIAFGCYVCWLIPVFHGASTGFWGIAWAPNNKLMMPPPPPLALQEKYHRVTLLYPPLALQEKQRRLTRL